MGGRLTGGGMGWEVEEGVVVGIADVGAELDDDEGGSLGEGVEGGSEGRLDWGRGAAEFGDEPLAGGEG